MHTIYVWVRVHVHTAIRRVYRKVRRQEREKPKESVAPLLATEQEQKAKAEASFQIERVPLTPADVSSLAGEPKATPHLGLNLNRVRCVHASTSIHPFIHTTYLSTYLSLAQRCAQYSIDFEGVDVNTCTLI